MGLRSTRTIFIRILLSLLIISILGLTDSQVSSSETEDTISVEQESTTLSTNDEPLPASNEKQFSEEGKSNTQRVQNGTSPVKKPRMAVIDSLSEENLLLEGYDKEVPPKLNESFTLPNGTTIAVQSRVVVKVIAFIRSVRSIEESDETITLDMDLYTIWMDGNIRNELRSNGKQLLLQLREHEPKLKIMKKSLADRIWTPDIYFVEADRVNRPKVLDEGGLDLSFYSEYGAPSLRLRMRVSLDCEMDFTYYPADTQKCVFHLRSSSYRNDEVHLTWWHKSVQGVYLADTNDPNFRFQVTGVDEYEEPHDIGPESSKYRLYSILKFELWIKRKMSYHIIQTYLPSVFFIVVTWLAYLIPPRMVEARIGVTMTTLLTMTSMFSSIRENTPIVGYVKAIDIWMVICVFFIFLTLFALTIGACIRKMKGDLKKKQEDYSKNGLKQERLWKKMKYLIALEIFLEKYMVFLLCAFFIIFIVLYWSWLLNNSSDYVNWAPNETYNRMQPEKEN